VAEAREYHHRMTCPCGTVLSGDTEDELVEAAFAHLREQHPDMVDDYGREHILFMAIKVPKPAS
jgi:predicted small metal-binding protein